MRAARIANVMVALVCCGLGCGTSSGSAAGNASEEYGANPFLEDQSNRGKADTAYQNPDGIEVEVDLEADLIGAEYFIFEAPAELGQFALTYLRKRGEFYLESLAEDSTSENRVEWLIDTTWMTAAQAKSVAKEKLRHFRIRGVNAVLLNKSADGVAVGRQYTAVVPQNPFGVMSTLGSSCADPDNHISLDQSVYWYLWNPDKSGCAAQTQQMTVTVSRMMQSGRTTYPEYDRLTEDKQVTAVVLFGQIGDGELKDSDAGMRSLREMVSWLGSAQFQEDASAPLGRRFSKHIGEVDLVIDLYSPKEFSGLSDTAHFPNFQKAISEHEIVVYDGHSMLGASDFWGRPTYPPFYQVFLYGGCLGYEYYVRPILGGKHGWDNLDMVSSVVEVQVGANEFAGPFLAKLVWSLGNKNAASWPDILRAIRERVRDSTFGVSGVRDNCWSPTGSLCGQSPVPTGAKTYEQTQPVNIPDNSKEGIASEITVADSIVAGSIVLDLDISHTWVGDLRISLQHGTTEMVVWDHAGDDTKNIQKRFDLPAFAAKDVKGTWTLRVVDTADSDVGMLNRWALIVTP